MYLVVAFVVRNPLGVLLVEVEAVLHQELHRLGFDNIILHAEERQVVDLAEIRVLGLQRQSVQSNTGIPVTGSCQKSQGQVHGARAG